MHVRWVLFVYMRCVYYYKEERLLSRDFVHWTSLSLRGALEQRETDEGENNTTFSAAGEKLTRLDKGREYLTLAAA